MQKENIYEYIMEPLEYAYRTRDFLAGITECYKRIEVVNQKMDTNCMHSGLEYMRHLYLFQKKMKDKDYRAACGKLMDAIHCIRCYTVVSSNCEHNRSALNKFAMDNVKHTLCMSLQEDD